MSGQPVDCGDILRVIAAMLQVYVWQDYDLAPKFPELRGFLDYWTETLEGALHSVRVAHHRLIQPSEWKAVDGIISVH
ncbi:hypothetical protein [Brucella anthropi]|uniref:hypothetical protein n=1 Tax=Brucella anthropi TaxID=529 RepID=UPI0035E3EC98